MKFVEIGLCVDFKIIHYTQLFTAINLQKKTLSNELIKKQNFNS